MIEIPLSTGLLMKTELLFTINVFSFIILCINNLGCFYVAAHIPHTHILPSNSNLQLEPL